MKKQAYIKRTLKITALMALVVMCLAACKKQETNVDGGGGDGNHNKVERAIIYTVGHSENQRTVATEAEWDALLDHLCDQAQSGNEVIFYNMRPTSCHTGKKVQAPKSPTTISTSSLDEIKAWMRDMEEQGRTVKVSYDSSTGTWTGVAYSTMAYMATDNIIGTWHFNCLTTNPIASDGHLLEGDYYVPEENGGSMYYTFNDNGYLLLTFNAMDGTVTSDSTTWTLTDEGRLYSDLLPNNGYWDVNWITMSTMIISRTGLGMGDEDFYYQLQFNRQRKKISQL